MPNNNSESEKNALPLARFALIGAALVALIAIGFAVWKRNPRPTQPNITANPPGGDINTAIAKLEARLKTKPDDAEGWHMLGLAFFQTQKFGEAAQAFARATQLDPGKSDYWSALGEARVLGGPGDKLVPDANYAFEKAVSINPKDPRARYFLAVGRDMAGDHKGAVDAWIALLADTPPGAPWEADVRRVIDAVATREKIDVASRLMALKQPVRSGGAAIATAGIPGPTRDQMQSAAQLPKGQQDAMIDSMVNGLEAKLKANPNNENGWIMLMRSRVQLGQNAKAGEALKGARAAFANDAAANGRIVEAASALGIAM